MLRSERLSLHCLSCYIYAFDSVAVGDYQCHSSKVDPIKRTTCFGIPGLLYALLNDVAA